METLRSAKPPCGGSIPPPASEMKKTVLIIVFLLFILVSRFQVSVDAQAFDFNKAYQDYQYQLGVYQDLYSAYQNSRDSYLKNQTLNLKEEARQKTLAMLKGRDRLISVYITMLRMKIVELKGLSLDEKNNIFGKIDPEVKWYQDHSTSYNDGDPAEILFSKSTEVADRYKNTTQPIIYESLFDISLGEEAGIRLDHQEIFSGLKDVINSGVSSGTLDINPFNRWFSDIEAVINILKDNETKGKNQISAVYGQYYLTSEAYNSSVNTLATSVKSLSELNNFVIEMLTSIKNQQK